MNEQELEGWKQRLADVVSSQVAKMLEAGIDTLHIDRAILTGLDRAYQPRGIRATNLIVRTEPVGGTHRVIEEVETREA